MKFLVTIRSVLPAAIGVLALGLGSASAFAATVTTTFQVTANVQATCAISATSAAFGSYTGVIADTTSIVTVTCSNTTTYNIGLNAGLGTGATVTSRAMTGPSSAFRLVVLQVTVISCPAPHKAGHPVIPLGSDWP